MAGGSRSRLEDGSIEVYDPDELRPLLSWKAHARFASAVAYNPDGGRIASASDDRTVRVGTLPTAGPW